VAAEHVKRGSAAALAYEAAGLRWLGAADAVAVVQPVLRTGAALTLPRIATVSPTEGHAEAFGRDLAWLHSAGAPAHGAAPDGWSGDGWLASLPLPLSASPSWGEFYATQRVLPYVRLARDAGTLDPAAVQVFGRLCDRLTDGLHDEPPSRLHGDLWSGNVLWSRDAAVLIDPAAQGGHRETDLAMLALFGLSRLDRVLAAYDEARPLADGWRDRVPLHQVHPLLAHTVLFGGSYAGAAVRAARASM